MCNHLTIVDTAIEQDEVDGVIGLTQLEIEYCSICDFVVEWRPTNEIQ